MTPDYAVVRISGGQTVLQQVQTIDAIAVFPPCMTVLEVTSTVDSYLVTVYVNDPAAIRSSTLRVKEGVIRAYWGSKRNVEKDVSVEVKMVLPAGEPIELWPASGTLFVRDAEFQMDVTALFQNGCKVDASSFSGINADVVSVAAVDEMATLTARFVDASAPAALKFVGYVANSCEVAAYPAAREVMVVKEAVPRYTATFEKSEPGCASVHVRFTAPVQSKHAGESPLRVECSAAVETRDMRMNVDAMGLFTQIDAEVCIGGDYGLVHVNVDAEEVATPSGAAIEPEADTVFIISREVLVLSLKSDYSARLRKGVYAMRNELFSLTFEPSNEVLMAACDFSEAFASDYLVELSATRAGTDVAVSVLAKSIDYHTVTFDASKVRCEGSFNVEFHPTEFKFAYDPYFVPGDILITRVNSYYSPEFDFVPLRKVYPWDRVFFTDEGWVYIGAFGFFVDHGSDGCISWSPKMDVEAGSVQQWSYKEMTESLSREIPREVSIDYSFQYEKHGFLLDFQDNLFIYTTDDQDESARYDSNDIRFIFGVYWSSSEWAPRNSTYEQITAEHSVLPDELTSYSIALGLQARPVPRGVNYMSINQNKFTAFTNTYYHMIEKIIDRSYWETSQKDRFPLSPTVSYVERPMDFTYETLVRDDVAVSFAFRTPYTFGWDLAKIAMTFEGEPLPVTVAVVNFVAYVTAPRPTREGEVRLQLEKGAFTYTADTTPAYTFESESFITTFMVYSQPRLTLDFDAEKLLQTVTVESTIACQQWDTAAVTAAILVEEEPNAAKFAFRKTERADRLELPEGFCVSKGAERSEAVASARVTASYSPVTELLVKGAHFTVMKTNEPGAVEAVLAMGADWAFDESAARLGEDAPVLASFAEGVATLTFNRTVPVSACNCLDCACAEGFNTLTLPGGLFTKGQERSVPRAGLRWDYSDAPVDVLAHVELPWAAVTGEAVHEAMFAPTLAPDAGSLSPAEALVFSASCAGLGFHTDSAFRTVIPVAIMHGLCAYEVVEGAVRDSYGNSNPGVQGTVKFDFRAPVGNAGFLKSAEQTEAELARHYFWNSDPVVAIFFDEELVDYNATDFLVTSDRCFVELLSYAIEDERSVVKYALHDCEEETVVEISVVAGVLLRDAFGNEALSEEAVLHLPLTFELDTTVPTVTLSTASNRLYGHSIDVSYVLSEERTTFSCEAIGVAVQESSVSIEAVGENTCRYTFEPLPVNGTYVIFFVPEGRFFDEAGNPNAPSNTLTPLALNKGAQISVVVPEYTDQVQTEFQVNIDYVWLCENYEHIFPSTFEYDRDIARIEKTGSVVSEEGRITQTFTITFQNFQTFPEERYKNMAIHIPSMVCTNALALPNSAVVFHTTFDSKPTVPEFDLTLEGKEEKNFDVTISFRDVLEFGVEEPAHYVSVLFQNDAVADCEVTREKVEGAHRYNARCPLHKEGAVDVTVNSGAVLEMTGVPSKNFTRTFYIDASPPTVTLAPRQTTFGPEVTRVEVAMTLSDPLSGIAKECFVLENTEGLRVDVEVPTAVLMGNTVVGVTLARTSQEVTQGSFSLYVKEHCARNLHHNWNLRSNTVTLDYDYVAPEATLSCPKEKTVLNTIEITGAFNEPCAELQPTNIQTSPACVVGAIEMLSPVAFSFTVSCYEQGEFAFSLKGYKDLVGNVGRPSAACSANFTIAGPVVIPTVRNLVAGQYVNTPEFEISFTAEPYCRFMNLTSDFYLLQNAKDVTTTQITDCHWVMTGRNEEEGNVLIRVKDNAAVDRYGGKSLSLMVSFISYQSTPAVVSVAPKRFAARKTSDVRVCYDWSVTRGVGGLRAEGACSGAEVKRVEDNCAVLSVAITEGERCFLYLERDFVKTQWELGSEGRYLFLDVDDSAPVVDATMTVGEREVLPVEDVLSVNANGVMHVVVPAGVTVFPAMLVYTPPACVESVQIEQLDEVKVSVAFSGATCAVAFNFKAGFFKDSFGRASPARQLTVRFDREPLVVDIAVPQYSRETPIRACATFNKKTVLTAENVMATVPVAVSHTAACENLIELWPADSGEFYFNLANVVDDFGNALPAIAAVPFSLYRSQPVAAPVAPVTLSTLARTTAATVVFAFSQKMATPPSALEELFAVAAPEGVRVEDVLTLEALSFSEDFVNVTLAHRATTAASAEYTLTLLPTAFVDLAGNTLAETSFTVQLDNVPPTAVATVNGDGFFAAFPVTLTLQFSKEVMPAADYFTKVTAEVNGETISFSGEPVTAPTRELTVTSEGDAEFGLVDAEFSLGDAEFSLGDAEFSLGDVMTVVMAAGLAVDAFGMSSPRSESALVCSNGAVLVSQTMLSNSKAELTFNMKLLRVASNKVEATGVLVRRIDIEGAKLVVLLESSVQGAWTLTFLKGAVVGCDESEESPAFVVNGVWDTVDPVALCDVPAMIGAGEVSFSCLFSKPVFTTSAFFEVTRDDVVLSHEEKWEEEKLVVSFVGIETRVPGTKATVVATLKSCEDAVKTACLPVMYEMAIDFTPVVMRFDAATQYVHHNVSVEMLLEADRPVETELTKEAIDVAAPEMGVATIESLEPYEAGRSWKLTAVFESADMDDLLMPFTLTLPADTVHDAVGNANTEATLELLLKDSTPALSAASTPLEEKEVLVTAVFTNGPVSSLPLTALEWSSNLEFLRMAAADNSTELVSVYNVEFRALCEVSCEFWVRFVAEHIYDDAGNRLANDVMVADTLALRPVLTFEKSLLCRELTCEVLVESSENIDLDCQKLVLQDAAYTVLPHMCLNTRTCYCEITRQSSVPLATFTFTVPEDAAMTSYRLGNEAVESPVVFQSTERMKPTLSTEWTAQDGNKSIAFWAGWAMPGMVLDVSMLACKNCEIFDWEPTEEEGVYAFKVSFFDDSDRYAVVSVAEGAVTDPFGRPTLGEQKVLRLVAEAPYVTRFRASGEGSTTTVLMEFSKEVAPCGGNMVFAPADFPQYQVEMATASSAVRVNGRIVEVSVPTVSNTAYTVSFSSHAFCDETAYPMDTACAMCAFQSMKGAPLAPIVSVEAVTAASISLQYNKEPKSRDEVTKLMVVTSPASSLPPVVVPNPGAEGSVTVAGLEPDTEYKVYVLFTNAYGNSFPAIETATTLAGVPKPAADLRVCDVLDPQTVGKNSYVYTRAKACWTPSPSSRVKYVLTVAPLDHAAMAPTQFETTESSVEFSVGNDVTRYRLTLTTVSEAEEVPEAEYPSIEGEFVTAVDLEQIYKYPQGAGIKVVAERLTGESAYITFSHPLENYFKIERYLVQYGNVFEDVFDASNNAIESLPFRMEQCKGNAVTLTVRAGVLNGFYGMQSNRVTIYCKRPRLIVRADAGFNFASYTVASEVAAVATCSLKASYAADKLAEEQITVSPAKAEPRLFKSLEPDTEYTIECTAQDNDFAFFSGRVTFNTNSDFRLPAMALGAEEDATIGASFAEVPIASVNMPGMVYCLAVPADKYLTSSRGYIMRKGAATYVFPQADDMEVLVSGLKPATHYHAVCIFEPDYAPALVAASRRLSDQTFEFVTREVPVPEWTAFAPTLTGVVPVSTTVTLTARLPVLHMHGPVTLLCAAHPEFSQTVSDIVVDGNVVIITPRRLQPGMEYTVMVPAGTFLDAATRFPLPEVGRFDGFSFIVTSDAAMITAPAVEQTMPKEGEVAEQVAMKVEFTFDRNVELGEGAPIVSVGGVDRKHAAVEVSGRVLTLKDMPFFPAGSEVTVVLPAGYICNGFGACTTERQVLRFPVGEHDYEPRLMRLEPANGATRVYANSDVKLVFNKEVVLPADFEMTFTDEAEHAITLRYAEEKDKVLGNLAVVENTVVVRGKMLPAGHTYSVTMTPQRITDAQGREALDMPAKYEFSYSQYPCGGNYISEDMGRECSCFLTSATCECHCDEEDAKSVMVRLYLGAEW